MKTHPYPVFALSFSLLLLCLSCGQHKGFEVSGNITGLADSTQVVLADAASGKPIDSTYVDQGRFRLKGRLEEAPTLLSLVFTDKDSHDNTYLFIGNEAVEVTGDKSDFPEKLTVTGSAHQEYKNKLDRLTADLNIARKGHLSEMFSLRASGDWNDSLQAAYWGNNGRITQIDRETSALMNRFFAENLNAYYTLSQLVVYKTELEKDTLEALYHRLSPKYKKSKYGRVLATYLANPPLKLNDRFYDFRAEDESGRQSNLSDFVGGKYVLLDFASPGCGWCKKALPQQREIAAELSGLLQPVTFYVDRDKAEWVAHNRKEQISWVSLWDSNGRYSEAFTKYGISATPSYFLIDRDGLIVGRWDGYQEDLEEEIRKIILP